MLLKNQVKQIQTKYKERNNEITKIQNRNHKNEMDKLKGEYIIKIEQMKIKHEQIISEMKNNNEQKINNNNNNDIFEIYYHEKFGGILSKYYDALVINEFNDIDMLTLLDNSNDLNEYNIIQSKLHQKKFISIINDIKIDRNEWLQYLKKHKIHYRYINVLNNNGIYTFIEFYDNFKNFNELNNILNNIHVSKKIFDNLPNNNNNNNSNQNNSNNNNFEGRQTKSFHG